MSRFLTPCFVRVQNPAERKELTDFMATIGRKPMTAHDGSEDCIYLIAHNRPESMWMALMGDSTKTRFAQEFRNCGTNVELFKALAAMNDSNDRKQWFICTKSYNAVGRYWYKGDWFFVERCGPDSSLWRKATAEEIVERFKNQQP